MSQQSDRAQRLVVVGQRLAHAHEDDVGDRLAWHIEAQHLLDDLARLEVASEAELARDAKDAAHGATCLCRDADRLAATLVGRGGLHFHHLDLLAVVQLQQQLGGEAVNRAQPSDLLRAARFEAVAQLRRKVGHA